MYVLCTFQFTIDLQFLVNINYAADRFSVSSSDQDNSVECDDECLPFAHSVLKMHKKSEETSNLI